MTTLKHSAGRNTTKSQFLVILLRQRNTLESQGIHLQDHPTVKRWWRLMILFWAFLENFIITHRCYSFLLWNCFFWDRKCRGQIWHALIFVAKFSFHKISQIIEGKICMQLGSPVNRDWQKLGKNRVNDLLFETFTQIFFVYLLLNV